MNKKKQDINKFHPILSRQRCRYHHLSGETLCLAVQMATLPMVWFRIIDPTLNDGYSDGQERMIVALRHSSLVEWPLLRSLEERVSQGWKQSKRVFWRTRVSQQGGTMHSPDIGGMIMAQWQGLWLAHVQLFLSRNQGLGS